jgi:hypothetical protein
MRQVPMPRSTTALRWLHGQPAQDARLVPRVYFSPRHSSAPDTDGASAAAAASAGCGATAGAGAAWLWQVRAVSGLVVLSCVLMRLTGLLRW